MSWRRSIDDALDAALRSAPVAQPASFAAQSARLATATAILLVAACASSPPRPAPSAPPQVRAGSHGAERGAAPAERSVTALPGAGANGAATPAVPAPPPPPRAVADFGRAVGLMKSGNAQEAELEFEQIATTYPKLAAPDIDLGLLYRKSGDLDRSERALREAVARDAGSAVAWCELGVTLRMRGKFHDAEDAYKRAIAADPGFAPAYRNLGVLLDLYLGDAPGALEALERYQSLTGEKEPVRGWIAELRRRAGKRPADRGAVGSAPAAPGTAAPDTAAPGTAGATGKTGD